MCGIYAAYDRRRRPFDNEKIIRQLAAMVHRGPDDQGHHIDGAAAIGMRRLSIVDLEGGHQPISNEDDSVWIVFNGEIYNQQHLRRGLEERGHRFKTHTDTETILHLYEEKGAACVEDLNGMFGFAIWDSVKGQLLVARDRLGIKPLYYHERDGRIQFASEIKVLLEDEQIERRVNLNGLHHYLGYFYVPYPESMFDGVLKVPPGHVALVDDDGLRLERYWDAQYAEDESMSLDDAVEGLRAHLRRAIELRLMAEVPLGAYLSGGIDSSIIVGLMAEVMNEPVRTFTLGFGQEHAEFNELEYAAEVARHFGTDHREFVVSEGHVEELLSRVVWHFDEPFGDGLHTYFISQMAKEHVTVALTGLGSDELFAGYDRHVRLAKSARFAGLPGLLRGPLRAGVGAAGALAGGNRQVQRARRLIERAGLSTDENYAREITLMDEAVRAEIYGDVLRDDYPQRDLGAFLRGHLEGREIPSPWNRLSYLELKTTMVDDFLNYVDRMGMAHSMELRVPFLDHQLVEFACTIPFKYKVQGDSTKHVLKKVAETVLPSRIVHRKKQPFFMPLSDWIRKDLRDYVRRTLSRERLEDQGYFSHAGVEPMLERHFSGRADHGWEIWALLVFQVWHDRFIGGADGPG